MDPEANLKEQRELVRALINLSDQTPSLGRDGKILRHAARLADLVEALDGWLSHGGFLPADWQKGR